MLKNRTQNLVKSVIWYQKLIVYHNIQLFFKKELNQID